MMRWKWAGATALLAVALAAPARAADADAIQRAIDRGVAYLKSQQRDNGTWPHEKTGATALAGLALLECGVPPDDPAVKKAAEAVRQASVPLTHTHSPAPGILFFDRLGDPADVPLVQSMAGGPLPGQGNTGGWAPGWPPLAG